MSYGTAGKEQHIKYKLPLYYSPDTCLNEEPEDECFRFLLIEHGSGSICFEDRSINFIAPTILCLNEKDFPLIKNCPDAKIQTIYFYPNLINSLFNYKNIRDSENNFSNAELQDQYLLSPFIFRNNYYQGQFSLEANILSKVSKLFAFIGRELQQQKDFFWPCRSRSYMLELLILITKLFDSNQDSLENNTTNIPENVANLITYLHNNYQEKITLDQLSTMFTTNRTSINDQFYKVTNLSIIDYLIKLRVNLAAAMLRDTMLPISEIIIRVGFNDNSNFWRTFKKHTALSPKEYRDQYCWIKD